MPVNISPDMNLPVPVVSEDPGPDWANNINACMSAIDSHDHAPGKGVQITPSGININADLPLNSNDLTEAHGIQFDSLVAAVTSLLRSLQVVDADLYFIDGAGNSVRITQGGSVTGSTGTITGLPSGTASAAFAGATFTFSSATNTPAAMNFGSIKVRRTTLNGLGVTISANSGIAGDYALVLPAALPASQSAIVSDASGNLSFLPSVTTNGTFSATFQQSGGYSQAVTIAYSRNNNTVTLRIPAFSATTTANAPIDTGATDVPSALRPANIQWCFVAVTQNGANQVPGVMEVGTTGQIRLFLTAAVANWPSGTASCGLISGVSQVITYCLT